MPSVKYLTQESAKQHGVTKRRWNINRVHAQSQRTLCEKRARGHVRTTGLVLKCSFIPLNCDVFQDTFLSHTEPVSSWFCCLVAHEMCLITALCPWSQNHSDLLLIIFWFLAWHLHSLWNGSKYIFPAQLWRSWAVISFLSLCYQDS